MQKQMTTIEDRTEITIQESKQSKDMRNFNSLVN